MSKCGVARAVALREDWESLWLRDEQLLLVSFGDYLGMLRRGAGG